MTQTPGWRLRLSDVVVSVAVGSKKSYGIAKGRTYVEFMRPVSH